MFRRARLHALPQHAGVRIHNTAVGQKFHSAAPGGTKRAQRALKVLDQAGVDQHAVEAPRLGAVIAAVEQAVTAQQNLLLRRE